MHRQASRNSLYKVISLTCRMLQTIQPVIRLYGSSLVWDQETIAFQGNHAYAWRITFNAVRNGSQCDSIWNRRFAFNLDFRTKWATRFTKQENEECLVCFCNQSRIDDRTKIINVRYVSVFHVIKYVTSHQIWWTQKSILLVSIEIYM